MSSYTHFFSNNNCELDTVLTRAVNILTTYELVKLRMLWTTGPSLLTYEMISCKAIIYKNQLLLNHSSRHYYYFFFSPKGDNTFTSYFSKKTCLVYIHLMCFGKVLPNKYNNIYFSGEIYISVGKMPYYIWSCVFCASIFNVKDQGSILALANLLNAG